jgi:ABC-2 type transport system ATP-binding protein
MAEVIQVEGLTKKYGQLVVVDGVNFSVQEGEVFGYLGPNGAGKTTTIRILVGLTRPTTGETLVNGFSILKDPVRAKETVGVVPEASNLYGELTAWENLVYMAQLYGLAKKEWGPRADELLGEFGLADRKDSRFQGFSRGMKRRLTIAAGLVHRPRLLFLDEPTTGLDVMSARGLRQVIRKFKEKGVTVFLTTHLIQEADELCDRVAIIAKGRVRIIDTPTNLRNQAQDTEVLEIKTHPGFPSVPKEMESFPEVERVILLEDKLRVLGKSVHKAIPRIVGFLNEKGTEILSFQTKTPTLEDAFVKLTGVDAEVMRVDKPQKMGGVG